MPLGARTEVGRFKWHLAHTFIFSGTKIPISGDHRATFMRWWSAIDLILILFSPGVCQCSRATSIIWRQWQSCPCSRSGYVQQHHGASDCHVFLITMFQSWLYKSELWRPWLLCVYNVYVPELAIYSSIMAAVTVICLMLGLWYAVRLTSMTSQIRLYAKNMTNKSKELQVIKLTTIFLYQPLQH